MAKILAIDPGNEKSAYLIYYSDEREIKRHGIYSNETILDIVSRPYNALDILLIEMVESYGMPVGKTVFQTCVWIGRFLQAWNKETELIYRSTVKLHLCNSRRAKDSNIRQALIDRFPLSGGGKIPQIGTKSKPGPLYGIKSDIWSALAIAVTYSEE